MKFSLTFKTPDVVDQLDDLDDKKRNDAKNFLEKWIEYGEYVTIDFDTKLTTAKVRTIG